MCFCVSRIKDGFPGADGSTIQQMDESNALLIKIYGADGNLVYGNDDMGSMKKEFSSDMLNGYNTIAYTVKHPMILIYNGIAAPYDWFTNNQIYQNNLLWADNLPGKGAYDPCPRDWRIATMDMWNDFSTTTSNYYIQGIQTATDEKHSTNGLLYNNLAWYPASGYFYNGTGTLCRVGSYGVYWSSKTQDIYARYLDFNDDGVRLSQVYRRAGGFSVRCVQE